MNEHVALESLADRLRETLVRVGASRNAEGLAREMLERYGEAHRAYHNATHIAECLDWLDRLRSATGDAATLEAAVWFHDAVYDPTAHDNEERSAELAVRTLRDGGASEPVAARVGELVRATTHDALPEDADARLLCDIDLAILGASHRRFDEYETQIRREYEWMSDAEYDEGRSRLMRAFASRERIYSTDIVSGQLEVEARLNIGRSLARLRGGNAIAQSLDRAMDASHSY